MTLKNIKSKGFTIVELLVVIVVIGILAGITMVSYTGVTNKAYTAQAQANAKSVYQVINIYQADTAGGNGSFPADAAAIMGYTTGIAKVPAGITVSAGTVALTSSNGRTVVTYRPLATAANGGCVAYFDFGASTLSFLYVGSASAATISAGTIATCT